MSWNVALLVVIFFSKSERKQKTKRDELQQKTKSKK
jgi:hypothetical protein